MANATAARPAIGMITCSALASIELWNPPRRLRRPDAGARRLRAFSGEEKRPSGFALVSVRAETFQAGAECIKRPEAGSNHRRTAGYASAALTGAIAGTRRRS